MKYYFSQCFGQENVAVEGTQRHVFRHHLIGILIVTIDDLHGSSLLFTILRTSERRCHFA